MIHVLLFIVGAALAWLTLKDVFDTVVVPGGGRNSLQVTRRIGFALLGVWKRARRSGGISGSFAPFVLVTSFAVWMCTLALGFGMMAYGVRSHFDPPIERFWDAVYEAGSALATVGLSPHYPTGAARWVVVGAGFCGLAVMTMAVTYLLEVQSSISRRDTGIIKLNVSAGDPPSALTLLERFAVIRNRSALPGILDEARNWCATVQQSHSAHPSLIYFRSVSTGAGWPAALGALLDLALFAEKLIDDDELYGPAILLREEGARMARELALIASLQPMDVSTPERDLEQVADRLAASGYRLRPSPDFRAIARLRDEYMSCVAALADHLGRPAALFIREG